MYLMLMCSVVQGCCSVLCLFTVLLINVLTALTVSTAKTQVCLLTVKKNSQKKKNSKKRDVVLRSRMMIVFLSSSDAKLLLPVKFISLYSPNSMKEFGKKKKNNNGSIDSKIALKILILHNLGNTKFLL